MKLAWMMAKVEESYISDKLPHLTVAVAEL